MAAVSPASAIVIALLINGSAPSSSRASRARVALLRLPRGRPAGLPLTPLGHCPFCDFGLEWSFILFGLCEGVELAVTEERVRIIQERYRVPFLLEHVIHLLPDAPAEFTPAGFLNAITSRTGCGLILDVYNLECDAYNQGLDIPAFLDELDFAPVRELHLAGGVQHNGFQLDIHSRPTCDSTLTLALDVIRRAPCLRVVTFEFLKEAIALLGHDTICAELARIRQAIQQ
jgi:uncharacterized protein (UPF0276 family)